MVKDSTHSATGEPSAERNGDLHPGSPKRERELALARRIVCACDQPGGVVNVTEAMRSLTEELESHLQTQEDVVLPILGAAGEGALVARMRREHATLRALLYEATDNKRPVLCTLAELLEQYLRFEDGPLRGAMQKHMSANA